MSKSKRKTRQDFSSKAEYQAWLKRSKAAKKGAVTRKKNRDSLKRIETTATNPKIKKQNQKRREKELLKVYEETGEALRRLREERERKKTRRENEKFIRDLDQLGIGGFNPDDVFDIEIGQDWIRLDGEGIAVVPSKAREMDNAWQVHRELAKAERRGYATLLRMIRRISETSGYSERELFTLLYSP